MSMYQKKGKLNPCKLDKEDLLFLISILTNDFSDGYVMNIDCRLNNIHINEKDIDTFLKHKELPDRLNHLNIRIYGVDLSNSKVEKTLELEFHNQDITLSVSGNEETWTLGVFYRVKNYLKSKKPWYSFAIRVVQNLIGFVFPLMMISFVPLLIGDITFLIIVSIPLILIGMFIMIYFNSKGRLLSMTDIQLVGKPNKITLIG